MNWSRDYFGMARRAAHAIRALDMQYESLKSAVRLGAQSYNSGRGGGVDPQSHQAAMDALLDFEREMPRLYAPHDEAIADALLILYGWRGRGGVAKLLGEKYADVVNWRWLQLRRWREIAADLSCSVRWAQMVEDTAFDWMDEYGEMQIREQSDVDVDYVESMRGETGDYD